MECDVDEVVLARLTFVCLLATTALAFASPAVEVHASCGVGVVADAEHVETLRSELVRALAQVTTAHVVDASIVTLEARPVDDGIEVHVEVSALVSDPGQHVHWVTRANATARGGARDRALLERDAISAAARDVGQVIARR